MKIRRGPETSSDVFDAGETDTDGEIGEALKVSVQTLRYGKIKEMAVCAIMGEWRMMQASIDPEAGETTAVGRRPISR